MRKILCLLLALAAVFSLAACAKEQSADDLSVEQTSDRTPVSLTMWVVTDDATTTEAQDAVEKAFNQYTKGNFTTSVDLVFLTEDEYYSTLQAKFKEIDETVPETTAAPVTVVATGSDTTETTAEETVTNEYGVTELKYPDLSDTQVDIILVKGYDMLRELVTNGKVQKLDSELSETGSAKLVRDYINAAYFDNAKIDGGIYFVPNSNIVGEYTYLLVNKAMAEKYYFDETKLTTLENCYELIEDIGQNETIAPMLAPINPLNTVYINDELNPNEFSVLMSGISAAGYQTAASNTRLNIRYPFGNAAYVNHMRKMVELEEKGYFTADPSTDEFGVAVIKGDYATRFSYEENYYINILRYPEFTDENIFSSGFAVSTHSKNLARSMEVISALNTRAELRNILGYGIENVHYEINDDGYLHRLNNDYIMNLADTGNIFIAYEEETMPKDAWKNGRLQNNEARVSPITGLVSVWSTIDTTITEAISTLNAEYKARLDAVTTVAEFDAFIEAAREEFAANADYTKAVDTDTEGSPAKVYGAWYDSVKAWAEQGI